jgi:hypothetical protein
MFILKKKKKSQIFHPSLSLKKPQKEEKIKYEELRRKEIIK